MCAASLTFLGKALESENVDDSVCYMSILMYIDPTNDTEQHLTGMEAVRPQSNLPRVIYLRVVCRCHLPTLDSSSKIYFITFRVNDTMQVMILS